MIARPRAAVTDRAGDLSINLFVRLLDFYVRKFVRGGVTRLGTGRLKRGWDCNVYRTCESARAFSGHVS